MKHLFRAIADPEPLGDIARSPTYAPEPARVYSDPGWTGPCTRVAPAAGWTWLRQGKARGRLFGGSLTVMARLGGIPALVPNWRDRIVFFETALNDSFVEGNPLHVVRAGVADLIAQGLFEHAAGLVVGRAFGYDAAPLREEYMGVIKELLYEGRPAEDNINFPYCSA